MTNKELIESYKCEFTYVPHFDLEHVQLDESISRAIQSGLVYHQLTPYGKLEFANMHVTLQLEKTIHPLCGFIVVGINDGMFDEYNPELPTADFYGYSNDAAGIHYWSITALFHETPLIFNQVFDKKSWIKYQIRFATREEILNSLF